MSAPSAALEIRKITPHVGAEIAGVGLTRDLTDELVRDLRAAVAEHGVVFLADQTMTPEQHKAAARRFGDLHVHPYESVRHPEVPEIVLVGGNRHSNRVIGQVWHSDASYEVNPPTVTMLHVVKAPPVGGDTMWADMGAAYDALSAELQQFLTKLSAVHDKDVFEGMPTTGARSEHPLVRAHPVTGRKCLYVNQLYTTRIVELTRPEGDAVLQFLFRHIETPEFHCRYHLREGSVAIWDNGRTQHRAIWDYHPHRRVGHSIVIHGASPIAAAPRAD